MSDNSETTPVSMEGNDDIESIIEQLRENDGGDSRDLIRTAAEKKAEFTPVLIQIIEDAVRQTQRGGHPADDRYLWSLVLLAEWKAETAWPVFSSVLTLPDEASYDLYGEFAFDGFSFVIANLVGDRHDEIDQLIQDPEVDPPNRWNCIDALLVLLKREVITRDILIDRLHALLNHAFTIEDEIAVYLLEKLGKLGATEVLPFIEQAEEAEWFDHTIFGFEEIKMAAAQGVKACIDYLNHHDAELDLLECLSASYEDVDDELDDDELDDDFLFGDSFPFPEGVENWDPLGEGGIDGSVPTENETTVRNEAHRVGRNDKCPCNSGKKYKKCCGRKSNLDLLEDIF